MSMKPLLIFLQLAKAGYGSVDEVEKWDARKVCQALAYINFCSDYESAALELNKGG